MLKFLNYSVLTELNLNHANVHIMLMSYKVQITWGVL